MRHSIHWASFAFVSLGTVMACSSSDGGAGAAAGAGNAASGGAYFAGAAGSVSSGGANGGSLTSGGAPSAGAGFAGNSGGSTGSLAGAGGAVTVTGGASGTGGSAGSGAGSAGSGQGGAAGSGAAGGGAGGVGPSDPSGMPVPGTNNVAQPSGAPGGFTVLNWAGFKAAVSFSFDDALSSQISNYSALNGPGVHLTFYLVSNNNPSSATWTQAAKDGHELGNHTAHHCHDNGTGCAWGTYAGSLGSELDQCTQHITQTFGTSDVFTTASPYGDAGYATPAGTRFLLNRGVNGGTIGANDNTSPYALPCHTAAEAEPASTFNGATDSARTAGKWQIFLVHSLGGDGGYNPVAIADVVSAITHAKTAGDVWADSVVHVGAYWRAQKLISALTPSTSGSNKTYTWTLPDHFPKGRFVRVKVDGGTLSQAGKALAWSPHGYYEVALDAGSVTLGP